MKRIRDFIILSLAVLVTFNIFSEYAVTATAPGVLERAELTKSAGLYGVERYSSSRPVVGVWPKLAKESAPIVDTVQSPPQPSDINNEPKLEVAGPLIEKLTELSDATSKPARFVLPTPDGNYCDPKFVGRDITFAQSTELTLDELLDQIHNRYGINFLMGPKLRDLPINIKTGSIPWNVLLRSQLFVSGVRARCITDNTIELVQNSDLPTLQDGADVTTRFLKLKFLQRTSGGTVDLAGRSQGSSGQGGCGGGGGGIGSSSGGGGSGGGGQSGETAASQGSSRFDKLITEIEKILGIRSINLSSVGGGQGGSGAQTEERRTNRFVTQIPGRNILVIRATSEEHALIDEIVARADRPPFQVVIKGLVYSANQDRLRDIGVQTTILGGNAADNPRGGIFGHTLGGAGTLFDFSAIIGTFDFNVQATALQQNGVISVKSRPFATVLDGLCATLEVGRQLPIVIDSSLGGVGTVTFVDASNNLAVTPYVIDDENGEPVAVTLDMRLAANDVDSSVTARGVPAISKRSVQTQLLLGEDKTAILGGFTVDQDSKTISKTPGLGDIPIIGELFKRRIRDTRINRLYFAISVSVIKYGEAIEPVTVPGATTTPPSLTPDLLDRSKKAEPKQVVPPKTDN
ncbi:MAG: type II and III secretion system protein [Acidobacteriota bacterium]